MRSIPRALLIALAALLLGCGEAPLRPKPVDDVRLDLTLSAEEGSRAQPIEIRALVRNAGVTTVFHIAGCACDVIGMEILDEQGRPVSYLTPCRAVCASVCGPEPLVPGEEIESGITFQGDSYRYLMQEGRCALEDAPSGTYTVVVSFAVYSSDPSTPWAIQRRATFRWTGPS